MPGSAKLHHVAIAVMLGDAGTAVDVARTVDLNAIEVTERKATLFVDTARAFLQWGKLVAHRDGRARTPR